MQRDEIAYEDYFSRQIKLWGVDTQRSLESKKIAIIGCGGLGSSLALALGTSGIGTVHLVDFDTVSLHNIHRQIAFTLADEGLPKSRVVARLVSSKNPFVKAVTFEMDFASFAALENSYDLILDATDNLQTRKEIDQWAKDNNTPWIYGSVEAFNGQVCFFDRADFAVFAGGEHELDGVAAPMVMQIASLQANLALRYLNGQTIEKDKLHYLFFDDHGALVMQKFSMPAS